MQLLTVTGAHATRLEASCKQCAILLISSSQTREHIEVQQLCNSIMFFGDQPSSQDWSVLAYMLTEPRGWRRMMDSLIANVGQKHQLPKQDAWY